MILFNRQSEVIEAHDPRVAELLELVAVEGIRLRISIDVILWLEDRGYVVDLRTGIAMKVDIARVTPTGMAVNHLMTPPTEREIEQTLDSLLAPAYEECEPDGTLQAMIDEADPVGDAYDLGQADCGTGRYALTGSNAERDAYIRGQNDAWAAKNNVTWWRRSER